MNTETIKQYQDAFANLYPEEQAEIREKLERQYAEYVVKGTARKVANSIGPLIANGASSSVKGDAERLFAGGAGSAGQAGACCSVSLGVE